MKKFALVAAIVLMAGAAFAQQGPGNTPNPNGGKGGGGQDRPQPLVWTLGTVVTTEYKKLTGTINFSTNGPAHFTADGVDYLLRAPRHELEGLISGDNLTVEGTFTTVKSEKSFPASARAFKLTIKGKEIDVRGDRRPPKGGNGPQDGPGPQGDGPDGEDGPGPQ